MSWMRGRIERNPDRESQGYEHRGELESLPIATRRERQSPHDLDEWRRTLGGLAKRSSRSILSRVLCRILEVVILGASIVFRPGFRRYRLRDRKDLRLLGRSRGSDPGGSTSARRVPDALEVRPGTASPAEVRPGGRGVSTGFWPPGRRSWTGSTHSSDSAMPACIRGGIRRRGKPSRHS